MVSEMECKDAKQKLSEDLDGHLTTEEHEQLEAHLKSCDSCRAEKADLSQVNEVLSDLAEPQVDIPDPEEAWKAIEAEIGDTEPGQDDPYEEPIEIDSSGMVDIRNLVDKSTDDDELLEEPEGANSDFFGMAAAAEESDGEDLHLASVAPPPVLMPVSKKSSWMVPAAIIGGIFVIGVVTLATYLFVKEGHRQKTRKKDQLARNLDERFEKNKGSNRPNMKRAMGAGYKTELKPNVGDNPLASVGDSSAMQQGNTAGEEGTGDQGTTEGETPSADTSHTRHSSTSSHGAGSSSRRVSSSRRRARRTSRHSARPRMRLAGRKASSRGGDSTTTRARTPSRTLDDPLSSLLGAGRKSRGSSSSARESAASLPKNLSRSQVKRVMARANSKMKRCYHKYKNAGLLRVSVSIKGSSGRITSARVRGKFKGTDTARCALRAVRRLRFPKFQNPTQSFTYPYLLR